MSSSIPFYIFMTVCGAWIAAELFVRLKLDESNKNAQD
jgi:hypothetical protein